MEAPPGVDPLNQGGSIYIDNSSPMISPTTIRNNTAGEVEASYDGGFAIMNSNLLQGSDRVGFHY